MAEQVFRIHDNELMGIVKQVDDTDMWQACTVFGYPLGEPTDKHNAVEYLRGDGLEVLLGNWQFLDADNDWYACDFVEIQPEQVTIRITDYGHPDVHQLRTFSEPRKHVRRA